MFLQCLFFSSSMAEKKKSEPRGLFGALRGLSNLLYAQCLALSTVAFVAFFTCGRTWSSAVMWIVL